jgi:hypothetical protein
LRRRHNRARYFHRHESGLPVIADTSRVAGDTPVNPFFISFVAIISGLMSENAIVFVQAQGAKFFAVPPDPETRRWARDDLRPVFKLANRDPEALRRAMNAEEDQFNSWISGKEPLPGNVQVLIASVLEKPPRELFTDFPPDDVEQKGDAK